ncbi:PD-(D/E)XK motif protein [Janibacter terrae]|uniref:PD-(D/E)XK motif protein n=1 Tax=Janibacter terrae TaxID=103817 RepID=A0ABZ2FF47_9MICO
MSAGYRQTVESFFALAVAKSRTLGTGQFVTEPLTVGYADVFLGVDEESLPHLLVPVHDSVVPDRRSAAVWITRRELLVGEEVRVFADLGCRDPDVARVFDRLVTEILEVASQSGERLDLVQARVLIEWRHLLSAARGRLSHEVATGLFGELSVLCRLAESQPQLALDAWVGPQKAVRDFAYGGRAIEVKSRVATSAERIHISSLDQLDSAGLESLVLAVVDVADDELGHSLGQLVDRAVSLGVPRLPLNDLLEGFGFVAGMVGDDERRMSAVGLRTWQVDDGFPRLTGANLPTGTLEAIRTVNYSLDLARLRNAHIDDWSALDRAMGWDT